MFYLVFKPGLSRNCRIDISLPSNLHTTTQLIISTSDFKPGQTRMRVDERREFAREFFQQTHAPVKRDES